MNTGQTLLTLGALMLISMIILNFNRAMNDIDSEMDFDRFKLEALSMLTSHSEQLSQYFFDEASTDTTTLKRLNDFTQPGSLGYEWNDGGNVDDIDDLHGVTVADTGISGVIYNVDYNIDYVTRSGSSIVTSGSRQYHKRVRISISDTFNPPLIYHLVGANRVRDTLALEVVVSYWFYN